MNQYIITGYGHTDDGALERRTNVRQHHLDMAKDLKQKGNYLTGVPY